jgi:hypothetical protein
MPTPIRPTRETLDGDTGSIFNDPYSLIPMSDAQKMVLDQITPEYKQSKQAASDKTKEQLFDIWNGRDENIIIAQRELNSEPVYKIPSSVGDYDIIRMVQEGVIINKGNRMAQFTETGKKLLGKKIMESENNFKTNRKKDKFVFSQIKVPDPVSEFGNVVQPVDQINRNNQMAIDGQEQNQQTQQDLAGELIAELERTQQEEGGFEGLQEELQNYQTNPPVKISDRKATLKKIAFKNYLSSVLINLDPVTDGIKVEKISSIYNMIDEGKISVAEAQEMLKKGI